MGAVLQLLLLELCLFSGLRALLPGSVEVCPGDEFYGVQCIVHTGIKELKDCPAVRKAHFHLGGMDIDVHMLGRHGQMQDSKGKAVLHEVGPVALLQACGKLFAAQHPSVDKKSLEGSAGAADLRFSQEAVDRHAGIRVLRMNGDDGPCRLPAVDAVDQLPQIAVACGVEFILSVDPVVERDQGMGQGLFFHQIRDIAGLGLGLAQEFPSDRDLSEQVADDDRSSVRCSDLLQIDLHGGIGGIGRQVVVDRPGPREGAAHLCDHFHLGDGGYTGQRLSAKAQGGQVGQILCILDLAGRVTDKSAGDLVLFDPASVVRDADHADAAVPNLNGDGGRSRVDGIFHQFLDNVERSFDHFSCRDAADGFLCEESDFHIGFLLLRFQRFSLLFPLTPHFSGSPYCFLLLRIPAVLPAVSFYSAFQRFLSRLCSR